MSVYSGFATRQLETSYSKSVFAMLYVISKVLIDLQSVESKINNKDLTQIQKIFKKMLSLETQKHLQPKFTQALKVLAGYYGFSQEADHNVSISIGSVQLSDSPEIPKPSLMSKDETEEIRNAFIDIRDQRLSKEQSVKSPGGINEEILFQSKSPLKNHPMIRQNNPIQKSIPKQKLKEFRLSGGVPLEMGTRDSPKLSKGYPIRKMSTGSKNDSPKMRKASPINHIERLQFDKSKLKTEKSSKNLKKSSQALKAKKEVETQNVKQIITKLSPIPIKPSLEISDKQSSFNRQKESQPQQQTGIVRNPKPKKKWERLLNDAAVESDPEPVFEKHSSDRVLIYNRTSSSPPSEEHNFTSPRQYQTQLQVVKMSPREMNLPDYPAQMPTSPRSVLPTLIDDIQRSYEDAHDTSPKHKKKKKLSKVLKDNNYYKKDDTLSPVEEPVQEQSTQKLRFNNYRFQNSFKTIREDEPSEQTPQNSQHKLVENKNFHLQPTPRDRTKFLAIDTQRKAARARDYSEYLDQTEPEVFNQPSISDNLSRKMKSKSRSPVSQSIESGNEIQMAAKKVVKKRIENKRKIEEMMEKQLVKAGHRTGAQFVQQIPDEIRANRFRMTQSLEVKHNLSGSRASNERSLIASLRRPRKLKLDQKASNKSPVQSPKESVWTNSKGIRKFVQKGSKDPQNTMLHFSIAPIMPQSRKQNTFSESPRPSTIEMPEKLQQLPSRYNDSSFEPQIVQNSSALDAYQNQNFPPLADKMNQRFQITDWRRKDILSRGSDTSNNIGVLSRKSERMKMRSSQPENGHKQRDIKYFRDQAQNNDQHEQRKSLDQSGYSNWPEKHKTFAKSSIQNPKPQEKTNSNKEPLQDGTKSYVLFSEDDFYGNTTNEKMRKMSEFRSEQQQNIIQQEQQKLAQQVELFKSSNPKSRKSVSLISNLPSTGYQNNLRTRTGFKESSTQPEVITEGPQETVKVDVQQSDHIGVNYESPDEDVIIKPKTQEQGVPQVSEEVYQFLIHQDSGDDTSQTSAAQIMNQANNQRQFQTLQNNRLSNQQLKVMSSKSIIQEEAPSQQFQSIMRPQHQRHYMHTDGHGSYNADLNFIADASNHQSNGENKRNSHAKRSLPQSVINKVAKLENKLKLNANQSRILSNHSKLASSIRATNSRKDND